MKKWIFIFTALIFQTLKADSPSDKQKDSVAAITQIFSEVTSAQPVCFGREYSTKDLDSRPQQTVKRIMARFSTEDEYHTKILQLEIQLKGEANAYKLYKAYMTCPGGDLGLCAVDCDGGRVYLKLGQKGQLRIINEGFIAEGGCGEDSAVVFIKATPGGDDVFDMSSLPNAYCQSN